MRAACGLVFAIPLAVRQWPVCSGLFTVMTMLDLSSSTPRHWHFYDVSRKQR
jgi:hypothetical protein